MTLYGNKTKYFVIILGYGPFMVVKGGRFVGKYNLANTK